MRVIMPECPSSRLGACLPASAPLCACRGLFHCLLGGAHSLAECDSFSTLHVQMPPSLWENVLCILIWVIASYIFFVKKRWSFICRWRGRENIFARIFFFRDFIAVLDWIGSPTAGFTLQKIHPGVLTKPGCTLSKSWRTLYSSS